MDRKAKAPWRRLGLEIRAARRRAKLTQAQVAKEMQVVPSTVSGWERGTRGVQREQAEQLDKIFGTTGVVVRAWLQANSPTALPEWYEEVEQLEQMMSQLREYQCQVIPGLIQTERYMRTLVQETAPWISQDEVDEMVRSRLQRQAILEKKRPPLIYMVLEANAVTRVIGGKDVLAEQLEHVLSLVDRKLIHVQVVPPNPGGHPGAAGPFRIYSFADKPNIASAEHHAGELLIDDAGRVQESSTIFGVLQAEALSARQSAEFIRKVKDGLDDD